MLTKRPKQYKTAYSKQKAVSRETPGNPGVSSTHLFDYRKLMIKPVAMGT